MTHLACLYRSLSEPFFFVFVYFIRRTGFFSLFKEFDDIMLLPRSFYLRFSDYHIWSYEFITCFLKELWMQKAGFIITGNALSLWKDFHVLHPAGRLVNLSLVRKLKLIHLRRGGWHDSSGHAFAVLNYMFKKQISICQFVTAFYTWLTRIQCMNRSRVHKSDFHVV